MPCKWHWCIITCCPLTNVHVVQHSPFGDHCLVAHLWHRNIWMLILICMTHFLGMFTKLQKVTISFIMPASLPVCPPSAWNSLASSQIFMKSDILVFFENLSRKAKLRYNLTRITGTWHEDQYKFLIISCWILLRIRNVSDIFHLYYQRLWLECR
jgi:hypothetical protein